MNVTSKLHKLRAGALLGLMLGLAPVAYAQQGNSKTDGPIATILEEKPYAYVEQMPEFEGGSSELMKFLANNIQYPAEAKSKGLEGLVVLSFIVENDGSIREVKTLKKLGFGTDEEATRVIRLSSGKWTAGRQNGRAVRVQYTLPIRFALSDDERASTAHIANSMPAYKGGQEAMLQTMKPYLTLPPEAKQENLNARVLIKFYVDASGQVSNIRVQNTKFKKTVGAGSELDYMDAATFNIQNKAILAKLTESAVEAVKATSGNWQPALKNGQPAPSELSLPVQFLGDKASTTTAQAPVMTKYTQNSYSWEDTDVKPKFEDGDLMRFLAKNMRYPAGANFSGIVKFGIHIQKNGKVTGGWFPANSGLPKEDGALLMQEINRVVNLMDGKWIPGKVDEQAVSVSKNFTVKFILEDGTQQKAEQSGEKPDVIVIKHK